MVVRPTPTTPVMKHLNHVREDRCDRCAVERAVAKAGLDPDPVIDSDTLNRGAAEDPVTGTCSQHAHVVEFR